MQAGQVTVGCLVELEGWPSLLLDPIDAPFHRVALLVEIGSWRTGRPPREPRFLRLAAWSTFSGMTALIPRLLRYTRLPREEYAMSAATTPGLVRGRPTADES